MAKSITRGIVLFALLAVPVGAVVSWRDAPQQAAIFVPDKERQSYSVTLTDASLDDVLASLGGDDTLLQAPGAWRPVDENALDAFGTAGTYNRWQLARLYGSRLARVARGARTDRGRVVEAWTLISPYPSADLRTLHPGTMRLILKVTP